MSVTPTASKQVSLETQGILELMLLSEEGNDKVSDQLLRTNKTIADFMAQVSEQLKVSSEENLLLNKKIIEIESQHKQERAADRALIESLQITIQSIQGELATGFAGVSDKISSLSQTFTQKTAHDALVKEVESIKISTSKEIAEIKKQLKKSFDDLAIISKSTKDLKASLDALKTSYDKHKHDMCNTNSRYTREPEK